MSHNASIISASPTEGLASSSFIRSSGSSSGNSIAGAAMTSSDTLSERWRACEEAEVGFLRFAETAAAARRQAGANASCSKSGSKGCGSGPSHGAAGLQAASAAVVTAETEARASQDAPELLQPSVPPSLPSLSMPAEPPSMADCCLGLLVAIIEQIAGLEKENSSLRQRCDDLENANRLLEVRLQLLSHTEGYSSEGGADHTYTTAHDVYSAQRSYSSTVQRARRTASYKDPFGHDMSWGSLLKQGHPDDSLDRGRAGVSRTEGTPADGSHIGAQADKVGSDSVGKFKGTIERVKNRLKGAQPSPKPGASKRTSSSRARDGGVWLGPTEVSIPERNPVVWDSPTVASPVAAFGPEAAHTAAAVELEALGDVKVDVKMLSHGAAQTVLLPEMNNANYAQLPPQPRVSSVPSMGSLLHAAGTEVGTVIAKEAAMTSSLPVSPGTKKKKKKASRTSSLAAATTEKIASDALSGAGDSATAAAAAAAASSGQNWSIDTRNEPHTRASPDPYLEALQKVEVTKEFARKYEEWNKRNAKDEVEGPDGSGDSAPAVKTSHQIVAIPPRSPGAPHRRWSTKTQPAAGGMAVQAPPSALQQQQQLRADKPRGNASASQSGSSPAAHGTAAASAQSGHRSDDGGSGCDVGNCGSAAPVWVPIANGQAPDGCGPPASGCTHGSVGRTPSTGAERAASVRSQANAPAAEKTKDKGKQSGGGRSRFTQRVKRELEKRLTRTREQQQQQQRGSTRSKSCERPEGKITDDFAEKLREWSVKQGHDPDYYGRMGSRARSASSVAKEAELAGPASPVDGARSSLPQQGLRTGLSDSSLDGIGKDRDGHVISTQLAHRQPSSDAINPHTKPAAGAASGATGIVMKLKPSAAEAAQSQVPEVESASVAVALPVQLPNVTPLSYTEDPGCSKQQQQLLPAGVVGKDACQSSYAAAAGHTAREESELQGTRVALATATGAPSLAATVATIRAEAVSDTQSVQQLVPAAVLVSERLSAPDGLGSCSTSDGSESTSHVNAPGNVEAPTAPSLPSSPSNAAGFCNAAAGQPCSTKKPPPPHGVAALVTAAKPALRDSFSELDALVDNVLSNVSSAFRSNATSLATDRKPSVTTGEKLMAAAPPGGDSFGKTSLCSTRLPLSPSSHEDCPRLGQDVFFVASDAPAVEDLPAVFQGSPMTADKIAVVRAGDAGPTERSPTRSCIRDSGEPGCTGYADGSLGPAAEPAADDDVGRMPVAATQSPSSAELLQLPRAAEVEAPPSSNGLEVCSQESGASPSQQQPAVQADFMCEPQCAQGGDEVSLCAGPPDFAEARQSEQWPPNDGAGQADQYDKHANDRGETIGSEGLSRDNEAISSEEPVDTLLTHEVDSLPTDRSSISLCVDKPAMVSDVTYGTTYGGRASAHEPLPIKTEGPLPDILVASDVIMQLNNASLLPAGNESPDAGRETAKAEAPLGSLQCSLPQADPIDRAPSDSTATLAAAVHLPPDFSSVERTELPTGKNEEAPHSGFNINTDAATSPEEYYFRQKMASLGRVRRSLSDSECSNDSEGSEYSDLDQVDSSTPETISTASEELLNGSSHNLSTMTSAGSLAWQCESNRQRSSSMGHYTTECDLPARDERSAAHSFESDASASSDPALLETVNQLDGQSTIHSYSRERLCDRLKALAAEYANEGTRPVERASRSDTQRKAHVVTESSSSIPKSIAVSPSSTRSKTVGLASQDHSHGDAELSGQTDLCPTALAEKRQYGNSQTLPSTMCSSGSSNLKKTTSPRAVSSLSVLSAEKTKGTATAAAVHALVSRFENQIDTPRQQLPLPHQQAQAPAQSALSAAWNLPPQRTFVSPVTKLKSAAELMTTDAAKKPGGPSRDGTYPDDIPQICAKRGQGNSGVGALSRKGLKPQH